LSDILFFAFVAIASDSANAQSGIYDVTSIDCLVVNSDQLFIATVKDYQEPDSEKLQADFITVEFAIEEVLKDSDPAPLSRPKFLLLKTRATDLAQLKEAETRLLVFADWENKRNNTFISLDFRGDRLPLVTADFEVLRDSNSLIRATKEVIANAPLYAKRMHTFSLRGPDSLGPVFITGFGYFFVFVEVPTDQRLEKKALAWMQSKIPDERSTGLEAIRFFKSKENIAKVRGLLNDPYKEVYGGEHKDCFVVREAAWATLRDWRVESEKPVLEE